ncbi:MAG: IS200/IS605 family transposase [Bacteroidota bacterium]
MSQTYYKLWIHLIWSTKDRQPIMQKEFRWKIFNHINQKAKEEGYHLDAINGAADHVHCLMSIRPKYSISEIVNKLKGESSHWINHEGIIPTRFVWQGGFAAFSVSESQLGKVRAYIHNQERHHQRMPFEVEVKKFLKLYHAISERA